jgi:hypothetical protein
LDLRNRVLRNLFGSKTEKITGEWRRLHNEGLHDLYSSPKIIRIIKSRRMRLEIHVARMRDTDVHAGFWWETSGKDTIWKI